MRGAGMHIPVCLCAEYRYFPNLYIPDRDARDLLSAWQRGYPTYAYTCPAAPQHNVLKIFVEPWLRAL
jgi:hypothetical protein